MELYFQAPVEATEIFRHCASTLGTAASLEFNLSHLFLSFSNTKCFLCNKKTPRDLSTQESTGIWPDVVQTSSEVGLIYLTFEETLNVDYLTVDNVWLQPTSLSQTLWRSSFEHDWPCFIRVSEKCWKSDLWWHWNSNDICKIPAAVISNLWLMVWSKCQMGYKKHIYLFSFPSSFRLVRDLRTRKLGCNDGNLIWMLKGGLHNKHGELKWFRVGCQAQLNGSGLLQHLHHPQ